MTASQQRSGSPLMPGIPNSRLVRAAASGAFAIVRTAFCRSVIVAMVMRNWLLRFVLCLGLQLLEVARLV
jgi:hypothetical protein